jgi:hypothetical protein
MARITLALVIFSATYAPSLGREEPYFPEGTFDEADKESNDARARWYTKYLHTMGEPSLWKLSKADHAVSVCRLLWLPSIHSTVSVRIVKSGKSIILYVVTLDCPRGGEPGKVSLKQTKKLTDDEWTRLQVYLERSHYWKMRTSVKMNLDEEGLLLDGDRLVCEGIEQGKYHIVDRLDPDPEYEKLCRYMLDLSGIDIREAWAAYHGEDEDRPPEKGTLLKCVGQEGDIANCPDGLGRLEQIRPKP